MSSKSYKATPTLKCDGKNCNNQGILKLKIRFIKKVSYFCKSCHTELKTLDLIDGEVIDVDQRVGSLLKNQ